MNLMKFLKEYKSRIIWIACTACVVLACILWLVLTPQSVPTDDPSSSEPGKPTSSAPADDPGSDTPPSSDPATSDPVPFDPGAELNKTMVLVNTIDHSYPNMPQSIYKNAPKEECVTYVVIRTYVLGGFLKEQYNDIYTCDQDLLFQFIHRYANSVMVDPANAGNDRMYLVPAERTDGTYVYAKDTIAVLIEDIFGIENYVINCKYYDPASETYTIVDYGSGGYLGLCYADDVNWKNDNEFSCTFYVYDSVGEAEVPLVKNDWTRCYTYHMKRSDTDPGNFYLDKVEEIKK